MNVLLVIDHFGPGGAQGQIVELACALALRGHAVEMFIYFPEYRFFRERLDRAGIRVHEVTKGAGFSLATLWALRRTIRHGGFDAVVSYLPSANIYAELACATVRGVRLVVSERTSHHDDRSWWRALARRLLHGLADRVVANSHTHAEWLSRHAWLRGRVVSIYNGTPLASADAPAPEPPALAEPGALRLLGVGRIGPEKNVLNLIHALARLSQTRGYLPSVAWAGSRDTSGRGAEYCAAVDQALRDAPGVAAKWSWLGLRSDVPALLGEYHGLVHPSLYEGLPNTVCEALAVGLPVLVSSVCDHALLVADGVRGYLFDPSDPDSIAGAIDSLARLDRDGWLQLSANGRAYARANLTVDRMADEYERLLTEVVAGRQRRSEPV